MTDEFEKWLRDGVACGAVDTRILVAYIDYLSVKSKSKEEPLAVLAWRKGYSEVRINDQNKHFHYSIELRGYPPYKEYIGHTYFEAESKARQYLEGLPDKEAKI